MNRVRGNRHWNILGSAEAGDLSGCYSSRECFGAEGYAVEFCPEDSECNRDIAFGRVFWPQHVYRVERGKGVNRGRDKLGLGLTATWPGLNGSQRAGQWQGEEVSEPEEAGNCVYLSSPLSSVNVHAAVCFQDCPVLLISNQGVLPLGVHSECCLIGTTLN